MKLGLSIEKFMSSMPNVDIVFCSPQIFVKYSNFDPEKPLIYID